MANIPSADLQSQSAPAAKAETAPIMAEQPTLPPNVGEPPTLPPRGTEDLGGDAAKAAPALPSMEDYEVQRELGRGGMGVVYKARHRQLGRFVALKMILGGGHASSTDVARFRTEAEAVARLQHPNIVQLYEIGEKDGLPFFALEFCGGGSLDKKLCGVPLPPKEAALLVEKLARAMHHAHQKGVVHRDLKPANILLAPAADKDDTATTITTDHFKLTAVPKISDFGLAKKLDTAGQTQSGAIMGTPCYMAPEQARGQTRDIGLAADVYALGAILYELLTGRPPFKAATAVATLMQAVTAEPVSPRLLQPSVSRDLETICLKCLQKDPRRRYPDANALAEDLRRSTNGEPILARPIGTVEQVWRWCKRKPALAAASSAAMLALLLTLFTLAIAVLIVSLARNEEHNQRTKAEKLAEDKRIIAEREKKAREEAEERRREVEKQAEAIARLAEKERKARHQAEWKVYASNIALALSSSFADFARRV